MTVAQEEIFGPVVTVIPFEDEKDADPDRERRQVRALRLGLDAGSGAGHRLARQIKAGMIGINMPYTAFPGIPFGGYKQSGFGRELGHRDARPLPRDEERAALDLGARLQPVPAVAGGRRHTPPPRVRGGYVARSASLVGGLFLFACGIVLLLESDLGLSPWDVLNQGIQFHTSLSFGTANVVIGLAVLFVAWALGQPPGIGTVANAVLIGVFIDALVAVPAIDRLDGQPLAVRIALIPIALVLFGAGSAFYIGAAMGAGPRDSLMLVLSHRTGVRIGDRPCGARAERARRRHRARRHVRRRHDRFAVLIGPIIEVSFGLLARSPLAVPGVPQDVIEGQ